MKIVLNNFVLLMALVFLSACGASASAENASKTQSESWINQPPSDTDQYFYAVGYGATQKDAKSDALATISAKISVDVASNFSSSVTATRQDGDEDVLKSTKNEVISKSKHIEYTDVKVKKSLHKDDEWIVLVEVNRDILVKTYERKLKKIDDKLKAEWEVFQNADPFEKLKLSVTMEKYLKETDAIFPLLHALKENYDDSAYTKRYLQYTKEMRKARDELLFKIEADENSQSLASLIRSKLSAHNAVFSDKNYNTLIQITTKAKKRKYPSTNEQFANLTFALRKTTIKVVDKDGNIVSTTVYKTKDASPDGFEDAIAKTAKYEKKIKQKGIFAFITGN